MYTSDKDSIVKSYESAKKTYAAFGVDTDAALKAFREIPVSLHNWQGDDIKGFEDLGDVQSQNVVTGNYPGAARNGEELRADIEKAFSLSPCKHRVNLHSVYAEPQKPTPRNEVAPEDFRKWIDWAKQNDLGLDFNASFFAHPMMVEGFSLSSRRKDVRDYWIKAGKGAREIAAAIGKELGVSSWNDIWIPDGLKDIPANRLLYREYLKDSLDRIFEDKYPHEHLIDVMEGKLFGIGVESFTVGSHEFYLAYAAKNGVGVCMDTGHYHPTESVVDKLSAASLFVDDILLHISRGVRWDSDHVLIQSDELTGLMQELKRGNLFGKVAIGLDYFDATINRVAAWVIGLRAAGKALLTALLEPTSLLEKAEASGDFTSRLALSEEFKNLPQSAVWDYLCVEKGVPVSTEWLDEVKKYETDVLDLR
ncbi:MAG: L-rhamnose isomerase [Oscillospiraceae bacterium]|jgi:L-rhamnose isomerase|nr:L-rhamnose isomerase [Oscillospiraceae bacterium]